MANDSIENKLDEDFIFYLSYLRNYWHHFDSADEIDHLRIWVDKLNVGDLSIPAKRTRNIYLSNLILCAEKGVLTGPFENLPPTGPLEDANIVFGLDRHHAITVPSWLQASIEEAAGDYSHTSGDGRTFMATRALPDGKGAFGYIAVTLAPDEPRWLCGLPEGELDKKLEEKYKLFEMTTPKKEEIKQIFTKRKSPSKRERVLTFYDALLENIVDELDGVVDSGQNDVVDGLLIQLENDLKQKGQYAQFEHLPDRQRRIDLLIELHEMIRKRREKAVQRESILDRVESVYFPESFWETSVTEEDKISLPAAVWEKSINSPPTSEEMEQLNAIYSSEIVEKFIELLSNQKEIVAVRAQKRHEKIAAQMKKELRKDGAKIKHKYEETKRYLEELTEAYNKIMETRDKVAEDKRKAKRKRLETALKMIDSEIRTIQKNVERKAKRGAHLASQINEISANKAAIADMHSNSIIKQEKMNEKLRRNIELLRRQIDEKEAQIYGLELSLRSPQRDSYIAERTQFDVEKKYTSPRRYEEY